MLCAGTSVFSYTLRLLALLSLLKVTVTHVDSSNVFGRDASQESWYTILFTEDML